MTIYRAVCTNAQCKVFLPDHKGRDDAAPAFCPECGTGVIERCPKCDTELPWQSSEAKTFCMNCGQRLRFDPDPITRKVTITID